MLLCQTEYGTFKRALKLKFNGGKYSATRLQCSSVVASDVVARVGLCHNLWISVFPNPAIARVRLGQLLPRALSPLPLRLIPPKDQLELTFVSAAAVFLND